MSHEPRNRRGLLKYVTAAVFCLGASSLFAAPARADRDDFRHGYGRGGNEWREHHRGWNYGGYRGGYGGYGRGYYNPGFYGGYAPRVYTQPYYGGGFYGGGVVVPRAIVPVVPVAPLAPVAPLYYPY